MAYPLSPHIEEKASHQEGRGGKSGNRRFSGRSLVLRSMDTGFLVLWDAGHVQIVLIKRVHENILSS